MSEKHNSVIAVIGIDIGKNSFHVVGLDGRGAIALRQKWSRGQVETRLANMPACLIGMEACVGAHHLSRRLSLLGHEARPMPAKYVRASWASARATGGTSSVILRPRSTVSRFRPASGPRCWRSSTAPGATSWSRPLPRR